MHRCQSPRVATLLVFSIRVQAKEAELLLVRYATTAYWVHPRDSTSGAARSTVNSAAAAGMESVHSEAEHNTRSGRAQKRRRASGGAKGGGKHPGVPEGAPEAHGPGREGAAVVPEELLNLASRGTGGAPDLVAVDMGTVLKAALTGALTGALAPHPGQALGQAAEAGE